MKQKCLGKIKVDGGLGWSPRAQGEGFAYLTRKIPTILFRFQSFCPSKEPRTQTPVSNDNPDSAWLSQMPTPPGAQVHLSPSPSTLSIRTQAMPALCSLQSRSSRPQPAANRPYLQTWATGKGSSTAAGWRNSAQCAAWTRDMHPHPCGAAPSLHT